MQCMHETLLGDYKTRGECKSWTLDSGLDYGLEYGLNFRLIYKPGLGPGTVLGLGTAQESPQQQLADPRQLSITTISYKLHYYYN